MAITTTSMYIGLHYGAELSNEVLAIPLLVYCVVMPIILFRHARAWWLTMDCYCDPIGFGVIPNPAGDQSVGVSSTSPSDD